ncbi:MAG: dephospho-CoA kinase, partial [Geopsychrobacter sp.]|nr:dephospho-CoA kinase [Geopsychrobacter sp.]
MGKSVLILGVTGSIASGKSLVADLLRQRGATLLSADQLAREVVAVGSALLGQLVDLFGPHILNRDGSLDRDALGAVIFADAAARLKLNRLL